MPQVAALSTIGEAESVTYPDQSRETYWQYTGAGLLRGRKDSAGRILKYDWDRQGRLTTLTNENHATSREQNLGTTFYGWEGDRLAWESTHDKSVHYFYEPDSFIPLAQGIQSRPIKMHKTPDWTDRTYRVKEDPLWMQTLEPEPFQQLLFYHCDQIGTPQAMTDEQGSIVWSAQYKAWGEAQITAKEGIRNPIRFQGQYFDHETGLHYNRHRYYDPEIGRFISKDPIGLQGGLNLYSYAPNPVHWVDPRGLIRWGEVASNGLDLLGSCVAGTMVGAVLISAPTGVTQVVGSVVVAKSLYSCGTSSYNLTRAFSNDSSYDTPNKYKTLLRTLVSPISCSKAAQNGADAAELGLDLVSGRVPTGYVRINLGYNMLPGYHATEVATVIHRPATASDLLQPGARAYIDRMQAAQSTSSAFGSYDQIKNGSEDCK